MMLPEHLSSVVMMLQLLAISYGAILQVSIGLPSAHCIDCKSGFVVKLC